MRLPMTCSKFHPLSATFNIPRRHNLLRSGFEREQSMISEKFREIFNLDGRDNFSGFSFKTSRYHNLLCSGYEYGIKGRWRGGEIK